MSRYRRFAGIAALAALTSAGACAAPTSPVDPLVITLPNISLNCPPSDSFAKFCSGTVLLQFSKAPASGTSYFVVLNAGNINGTGTATGSATVEIDIDGQTLSCPFTNPSNLIVYQGAAPSGSPIASLDFQWTSGTLCSNW
jgi:hypothetical protein